MSGKSLLPSGGSDGEAGNDDGNGAGSAGDDGTGAGGGATGGDGGADQKPDWLPDELWSENGFNADALEGLKAPKAAEDLPDSPDGYTLPDIEGATAEELEADPTIGFLLERAHKLGLGQAAFAETITEYRATEQKRMDDAAAEELGKLGERAQARLADLDTWLKGTVKDAGALAALRNSLTSADAVKGLEQLMKAKATPTTRDNPPPPKNKKSQAEIEKLMASDAYADPRKRDPAVVKEVDDWFAAEHK